MRTKNGGAAREEPGPPAEAGIEKRRLKRGPRGRRQVKVSLAKVEAVGFSC